MANGYPTAKVTDPSRSLARVKLADRVIATGCERDKVVSRDGWLTPPRISPAPIRWTTWRLRLRLMALVLLSGRPGAGKTEFGKWVAAERGHVHIETDAEWSTWASRSVPTAMSKLWWLEIEYVLLVQM